MYSDYGKLSTALYDFTKPVGKSINGDIEYYTKRLENTNGRVLEAGVGSGRILIPLLEKGFKVDGVDASSHMLQSCKQRCEKRGLSPSLFKMRLEDLNLPNLYETIIMPTGTFCLIESHEQAVKVLRNFKHHLVKDGRIIIDLLLPSDFKEGAITTNKYDFSDNQGITMEIKSLCINWIEQKTTQLIKYEKWINGKLVETELQRFVLRWFGVQEFTLLLKDLGYKHIVCSSDYTYGKYPTNSEQIITFEAQVG